MVDWQPPKLIFAHLIHFNDQSNRAKHLNTGADKTIRATLTFAYQSFNLALNHCELAVKSKLEEKSPTTTKYFIG
jgi:hypothetical protein